MPWATAAVSTKTLKVEPGWRRAWTARLNWFPTWPGVTAFIARIAPVRGSIATSAEAGSVFRSSVSLIACSAARCSRGSIVV